MPVEFRFAVLAVFAAGAVGAADTVITIRVCGPLLKRDRTDGRSRTTAERELGMRNARAARVRASLLNIGFTDWNIKPEARSVEHPRVD